MILGIISDTHRDEMNAVPHIMKRFKEKGVEVIIHCGDIEPKHLKSEMFLGLPVICALVDEQTKREDFITPPCRWKYTKPGERVLFVNGLRIYVGHKRSFEFLTGSESCLAKMLDGLRRDFDGLRWLFSGHTHHQIFKQGITSFLNPGAVEDSFDGYEYAIVDTEKEEVTFSRIPKSKLAGENFSIGVISDSLNISKSNPDFWQELADSLRDRGVKNLIHCGNISLKDVGRKELNEFCVYYNLRMDQKIPDIRLENWKIIDSENPVVKIGDYRFYIQLDLGAVLLEQSELDMYKLSLSLRREYPEIDFILCGFTYQAFLEEGEQATIINPGNVINNQNFVVITLPAKEITFSHIPSKALPSLE